MTTTLENYFSDPRTTPEEQLVTDIRLKSGTLSNARERRVSQEQALKAQE
jgi:hypothetical protein